MTGVGKKANSNQQVKLVKENVGLDALGGGDLRRKRCEDNLWCSLIDSL